MLAFWLITLGREQNVQNACNKNQLIERTILRLLWALLKEKITLGHSSFTRPVVSNPITYLIK